MKRAFSALALVAILNLAVPSCQPIVTDSRPSVVVTYAVLGALVRQLAGESVRVTISVPNGLDPHEWEPSARDIEAINKANLVVQNGLGLEGGLQKTLAEAKSRGVGFFTASDFVEIRHVGPGEGIPSGDLDQQLGAPDPHLWTDPPGMKNVIAGLAQEFRIRFGLDFSSQAADLESRLNDLNENIAALVSAVPEGNRKLVTGHESLGYFASRYEFRLIGAVIPSLTSQAEPSVADVAALKKLIAENQVSVVFTELGTPSNVADVISRETGARLVELNTHVLPADGSYFTLMTNMAQTITEALK